MDNLLDLCVYDFFAIDGRSESFLELGRKFKVFMLHRETDWDQAVEAKILCEAVIELGVSKLLEEEHKNFGETFWILIRDRQVALTLQAANVALDEEVQGKGKFRAVSVLQDARHESD